ncbi:MAG: hypothetical protein MJ164_03590 [Alphaproteobacteria bacterium]|nr:hypothetical protein [Alphaproteobacteria bacterium]
MNWPSLIFLCIKYALAIIVIVSIALAPAWLARQTKKNKTITAWVRIYSWLLGWTGIGWLAALYLAVKK